MTAHHNLYVSHSMLTHNDSSSPRVANGRHPALAGAGHGQASSLFSMQFLVRTNKKHTKKRP